MPEILLRDRWLEVNRESVYLKFLVEDFCFVVIEMQFNGDFTTSYP